MRILSVVIFLCIGVVYVHSQPTRVQSEECANDGSEGTWTQVNGATVNGCPCYESDFDTRVLYLEFDIFSGYRWIMGPSADGTCQNFISNSGEVMSNDSFTPVCDITQADLINCAFTEIIPDPIPTISQWGLIILGLCLSVISVVAVRRKIYNLA